MRKSAVCGLSLIVMAIVWSVALAGSSSQHEMLVKEMLDAVNDITKELTAITNEKSATEARPKLRKAATRLLDLRKKADDAKQPDKAEKDRLAKKYKEKFDEALKNLSAERARVKTIEGGDAALKEIAVLNKKKPKR